MDGRTDPLTHQHYWGISPVKTLGIKNKVPLTYFDGKLAIAPDAEVEQQILVDVVQEELVRHCDGLHQQLYGHQHMYVYQTMLELRYNEKSQ